MLRWMCTTVLGQPFIKHFIKNWFLLRKKISERVIYSVYINTKIFWQVFSAILTNSRKCIDSTLLSALTINTVLQGNKLKTKKSHDDPAWSSLQLCNQSQQTWSHTEEAEDGTELPDTAVVDLDRAHLQN